MAKVGRPSEYYPEICQEIITYFKREPEEKGFYQDTPGDQGGVTLRACGCEFPTIEGFCASIDITKQTLHRWIKENRQLSDAYDKAKQYQEHILITNGLKGHYNSNFARFVAINLTSMKDKQEIDHKSSDKSMQPIYNFIEKK